MIPKSGHRFSDKIMLHEQSDSTRAMNSFGAAVPHIVTAAWARRITGKFPLTL